MDIAGGDRNSTDNFHRLKSSAPLKLIITLTGFCVYLFNAFQTAVSKVSFLDEGLYLVKGWLVVSGRYTLFADYGLWTNHMPFSFLIPGVAQVVFGPGLRTGRYFAIFIAALFLIGLYLTINKTSNGWWAALGIWVFALNPAMVKLYSMALTEGIVAAILIWIIYLGVIPDRKTWQLAAAGFLSAFILLTRENMVAVLPIFLLFVFLQYGSKKGIIASSTAILTVILVSAMYWPNILQVFAMWVPQSISPFLDKWRLISDGVFLLNQIPDKASDLTERLTNLGILLRNHFVSFLAFLIVCFYFPKLTEIRKNRLFLPILFLGVIYVALLGMHLYATFGLDYCVSCILLYVGYFEFIPLILLPMMFGMLVKDPGRGRTITAVAVSMLMVVGILISAIDDLMKSQVFNSSSFFGRFVELGNPLIGILQDRFNLRYYQAVRVEFIIILLVVILVMLAAVFVITRNRNIRMKLPPFQHILYGLLGIGLLLSPTTLLGKANDFFSCSSNVLDAYDQAGAALREYIPAGQKLYWEGRTNAILLYLPQVEIYPPQLNHSHSYYKGGNSDALLKMGRYNDQLATTWLESSQFILLEKQYAKKWEKEALAADGLTTPISIPPLGHCDAAGVLDLFIRE